jgi:cyclic beta-1,2-glucan synthetase
MAQAERTLLEAVARAVLSGDRGELRAQLDRPHPVLAGDAADAFAPGASPGADVASTPLDAHVSVPPLTLANGVGGFADEGREYVIALEGDHATPLPWANVMANPRFGTVITASGSAHTWSGNSRENRLTPFAHDPVIDPTAEALFVRDDESGEAWSPTPGPMTRSPASGRFVVRHGAGSRIAGCRHSPDRTCSWTPRPGEVLLLALTNDSDAPRTLSVFAYNDWALDRRGTANICTSSPRATGDGPSSRECVQQEFAHRVAFACASELLLRDGDRLPFSGATARSRGRRRFASGALRQFGAGSDRAASADSS